MIEFSCQKWSDTWKRETNTFGETIYWSKICIALQQHKQILTIFFCLLRFFEIFEWFSFSFCVYIGANQSTMLQAYQPQFPRLELQIGSFSSYDAKRA